MKTKNIITSLFWLILAAVIVVANLPYLPNPENKATCQNTSGKWLTVVHKAPFLDYSYLVSDIYCQCYGKQFIKITMLEGWLGCVQHKEFMNEEQFINELKNQSKRAKSVSGDMDREYINIIENDIKQRRITNALITVIVVFFFYLAYIKLKRRRNVKK